MARRSAPPISLCCSPSAGSAATSCDLSDRLERFRSDGSRRARDARRLAGGWATQARQPLSPREAAADLSDGALIAMAYPDRIAKARGAAANF